ncbi:FAD-dependent oxidoreductase [Acidiphilium sp. AL]|uniref:FAD-dependent oxidoreductase n=1 Tax=Acidiphilium sp. AL TaxID=2871704 RepID=UPI0021CB6AB1|nr:bifunctional TVP38/TMEM64 family protein/FAD-dependent oxidoreductase [Acidiphilium sp. AL]MCU4158703.1 FAD-dependent oxidoreductase [Acidiphilium sp. AL]
MSGSIRRSWLRWFAAGAIAIVFVLFFTLGGAHVLTVAALRAHLALLGRFIALHPVESFALYFALYVVATGLSVPGAAALTLGAGALFGLAEGVVLVSFAASIGASIAFLVSRFLLRDWAASRFPAMFERVDRGVARDGAFYILSLRLVPAVPFVLINTLAGLTRLDLKRFYWASQLGMLPGTIIYVNAGVGLARLGEGGEILPPRLLIGLLLLAILPIAATRLRDALARKRIYTRWQRPRRFDRDVVVIGAGSAGLVSAYVANALRAEVTLIEAGHMGGDCLNTGCVPSKSLLRSAREGLSFTEARMRIREAITAIAPHDSVARYASMGIDVRQGRAMIETPWSVRVDGEIITTRGIIIATGAAPIIPPIPGLAEAPYVTSETIWDMAELPRRLVVLGGGPIGCEMAQGFARLGAEVTLVEFADRVLLREDDDVSAMIRDALSADGVRVLTGHRAVRADRDDAGFALIAESQGNSSRIAFDRILVAVGRKPRAEGFGLEALEIAMGDAGVVETDAYLRTILPNILACGDVSGPFQFTHAGGYQGGFAALNALFGGIWRFRPDYRAMPAVTFTAPEVARVGLNASAAREAGIVFEETRYELADLDRAIIEGTPQGFVSVLTVPGKDRILGATIVGADAGEMLAGFTIAMQHKLGLKKLLGAIYPYPTRSEAVRAVAGAWRQKHASARGLAILEKYHAWRRG